MKIKITLKSGKEIITKTHAPTIESFMEQLAYISSGVFDTRADYFSKYGDFIEIYRKFIRYSEIDVVEEILA